MPTAGPARAHWPPESDHLIHVILNPTGGSGRAPRAWARAEPYLAALGRPLTVHSTTHRGSAKSIAAELAAEGPAAVVVAVGGDGTAHEVAHGLLRGGAGRPEPAFGLLPAGSGNDFARQIGASRDPAVLATTLSGGDTRRIDAGQLVWPDGEEWFVNIASAGFTGAAARMADQRSKRFGVVNYVWSAILTILAHRDYQVAVGVDGTSPVKQRLGAAVIANGQWFGAGMHVAPIARVDDGVFDLLTIQGAGRLRLLGLLMGVFSGRHLRSRTVGVAQVRTVRLEWEGDLPIEAEGELVPARSPLVATIHPGALRVLGAAPKR